VDRPDVAFRVVPVDTGDGAALLAAYAAELAEMYDGADVNAPGMPQAGPVEFGPPSGRFLVGYDGATAVCCGGLKRLPDGSAEIKRMYVVPSARRRGVARLLLHALEDAARDLGYRLVRMDTGAKHQHAIAFYEDEGYQPVADYNGNPLAAWWAEKHLG
jgi:GNAT superfamily N-acetyltransferase